MRRTASLAAAALCAVVALSMPALAQVITPAATAPVVLAPTVVDLGPLLTVFIQYAVPILGLGMAALWAVVRARVYKATGIRIDDGMRASLQSALTNAAGLMLQGIKEKAARGLRVDVKNEMLAAGIRYVETAAPDALVHFKLGPNDLAEKLKAKLGLIETAKPSLPVEPAPGAGAP